MGYLLLLVIGLLGFVWLFHTGQMALEERTYRKHFED